MTPMDSKDFGFWRSFGSVPVSQMFFAWDFILALMIAGIGTTFYVQSVGEPGPHVEVIKNLISVEGNIFGVVLAGFAIVAALLGDRYSRLLEATQTSATKMLRHFLIVGGILVCSIVLSVAFVAYAGPLHRWEPAAEQVGFGVTTFIFLWALFGCLELMKLILGVAATSTALHGLAGGRDESQDRLDRRAK